MILKLLSKYLYYLSFLMLLPLGLAAYYQFFDYESHPQPHSTFAFVLTLSLTLLLAFVCSRFGSSGEPLRRREGIILVVAIWLVTSLVSAFPFYFSRTLANPIDAYFEAISGLTTTGASMIYPKLYNQEGTEIAYYITNLQIPNKTYSFFGTVPPVYDPQTNLVLYSGTEAVSKAILFWRSLLQWVGGLGIVVIFLTVLPTLQVGGRFLYQTEMTGPIKEGLTPRVKSTASQLWGIYLSLTFLEILLLVLTNRQIPFFDAVCISLSTISTGGFSVTNDSIASYGSAATDCIVLSFMILGSINFSLYYYLFKGKCKELLSPDFFLFLGILAAGTLFVSLPLLKTTSLKEAFLIGSFQAISVQTSTGFITANYDTWPFISQMFLLLLMFIGGMSGSTAGGIKTSRFYILFKIVQHRLESIYRPDTIRTLRIGSAEVDDKNALTVLSFFCIVAFFVILGTVSLVLDNVDPETSLGLISCFLNNVGCAFRGAGPTGSFNFLSPLSKILSMIWMLLGRLEYFVVLLLFLPSFWKNR